MLKLIPSEVAFEIKPLSRGVERKQNERGKRNATAPLTVEESMLRAICTRFVRFVNHGKKFTLNQIDELIVGLQRAVLRLQKQKYRLLEEQRRKYENGKNR